MLSVVCPVYRSAAILVELHRRLSKVMGALGEDYEIIMVEDCGGDDSWAVIEELAASDPQVRGIKLSRNFGQHAATICGISSARGEYIITLDDDLEHSPEDIPLLVAKARTGYALVYGVFGERTHAAWRNATSDLARRAFRHAIPSLSYQYTSFRVIEAKVAKALAEFDSPFPFVDGYLSWITDNYATVELSHARRAGGASNYGFRKLLLHTVNIFVTFSDLPLRAASYLGLTFFLVGIVWLSVVVVGKLSGAVTVSGFSTIMAAIVLFGGIQLLILGVFGEYLGRVNFKSSRKPLYLVGQKTGFSRGRTP